MFLVGQIETEKDQKMLKKLSKIQKIDKKENPIILVRKSEKTEKEE